MRTPMFFVAIPSTAVAGAALVFADRYGAPTLLTAAITVVVFYATAYALAVPVGITTGLLRYRRRARG